MAFDTKNILRDLGELPIPQYFNKTLDKYEATEGSDGATHVKLTGSNMELFGKSSDTKPTTGIKIGTAFFEIDTTTVYMWDGSSWVVI